MKVNRSTARRVAVTAAAEINIMIAIVVGTALFGLPGAIVAGLAVGAVTFCTYRTIAAGKPPRPPMSGLDGR